jgi:hypothetical protein
VYIFQGATILAVSHRYLHDADVQPIYSLWQHTIQEAICLHKLEIFENKNMAKCDMLPRIANRICKGRQDYLQYHGNGLGVFLHALKPPEPFRCRLMKAEFEQTISTRTLSRALRVSAQNAKTQINFIWKSL